MNLANPNNASSMDSETERITDLVRAASVVLERLASSSTNDTYVFNNELNERLAAAEAEAAQYRDRVAELENAQKANRDMIAQPPKVAIELATECLKLRRNRENADTELRKAITDAAQLRATLADLNQAREQRRQALGPHAKESAQRLAEYESCLGIKLERVHKGSDSPDAHASFLVTFADGLGDVGLRLIGGDGPKHILLMADKIPRTRLASIEREFDVKHNLPILLYRVRNELKAVRR